MSQTIAAQAPTTHKSLLDWVGEIADLTQPDAVHWCDGSAEEYDALAQALIDAGTFERLSDAKRPNSYLALSDPGDVARVEDRTFICSRERGGRRSDQQLARSRPRCARRSSGLFKGCMVGRTMYVVPFSMGPLGSPIAHIGVQLTDSAYVATNMRIMTRMGKGALDVLGTDGEFVPCVHSVGMPLAEGEEDVPWPCNADNKYIVHYPETREIWSFGSGYGGNALLGKKCFALRIASAMARDEGWMAEHMLILKLTSPEGTEKYVTGAFPSACGKTNLAMLIPTLPDWKVETVGDDIAWMKFGEDGRLYAVNPEAGFFGVAPNTSHKTNPNAMDTIERNSIFTNCAKTDDGDIWWEGMTGEPPAHAIDWHGNDWTPESDDARRAPQRPLHDAGGAVSLDRARVGGPGRRADRCLPLRRSPRHGRAAGPGSLRLGARRLHGGDDVLGDDRRRRRCGRPAALRPDGDAALLRLQHGRLLRPLAEDRQREGAELPRVFYVNWFRKDADGKFLWPGFGENSRVLEWVFRRCEGTAEAIETPIGLLRRPRARSTPTASRSRARRWRSCSRSTPSWSSSSCRRSASTWRSSATSCQRSSPPSSTPSSSASAEALLRRRLRPDIRLSRRLGQLGILRRQHFGQLDHHLALLPGGVVLHLAVDHVDAAAVGDRLKHLLGELDLVRRRAEDLLGDVDLDRVQRPGADAAEQEGGAELGLAAGRVLDVAEGAVEGQDPGRGAGVDHAGDRVVPGVLLGASTRSASGFSGSAGSSIDR